MLSNAYFLAKFRFDTAENEPAKNLQNFAKIAKFAKFANFADPNPLTLRLQAAPRRHGFGLRRLQKIFRGGRGQLPARGGAVEGDQARLDRTDFFRGKGGVVFFAVGQNACFASIFRQRVLTLIIPRFL